MSSFDSTIGGLHMADQYLQFTTRLNSDNLYGFGEHEHHTLKLNMDWEIWPLWTRDHAVNTVIPYLSNFANDSTHLAFTECKFIRSTPRLPERGTRWINTHGPHLEC